MVNNLNFTIKLSKLDMLLKQIDEYRIQVNSQLNEETRSQKGQFMTPMPLASILADKFRNLSGELSIIDAGAGIGSLTAALVKRSLCDFSPSSICINTWELEDVLVKNLNKSLNLCSKMASEYNVSLRSDIYQTDFISYAVNLIQQRNNGKTIKKYNKAILNPPYLKIAASGKERKLLRSVGIEVSNLYSCFVSLALMLLDKGGELVAITPRSFCNGPYFNDFRRILLDNNNLSKLHVFESRNRIFKDDKVLQENVIFHIIKGESQGDVEIISSSYAEDPNSIIRITDFNEVVIPSNPDRFIHIVTNDKQADIATRIGKMPCSLEDLGVNVSTGKVVDFRTKPNLRNYPDIDTVPLIYPMHFNNGLIQYPIVNNKKPNAIVLNEHTQKLMVPNGTYILVKRLTSKEENRRIVAGLYTKELASVSVVGFENKINYFHKNGKPLDLNLAKGLWAYLNSHIVDQYFRQFNGNTQVNATDLYKIRYPNHEQLVYIGKKITGYDLKLFDELVEQLLTKK